MVAVRGGRRLGVEAGEVWRGWKPVLIGRSIGLVCLKDTNTSGDNVARKVADEGDIALVEGVVSQEVCEVRAGEDHDHSADVVEVSGDGVL